MADRATAKRTEQLRLASVLAPILRSLNRPIRKIKLESGGYTDSHAVAIVLLAREGLEIDAERIVRARNPAERATVEAVIRTCVGCGAQYIPRRKDARTCTRVCAQRTWAKKNADRRKEYKRAYRDRTKEQRREYQRRTRATRREYERVYREAHRNDLRVKERTYRARNREKLKAKNAAYRKRNPLRVQKTQRDYWAKNREAIVEKKRARRREAKKKNK